MKLLIISGRSGSGKSSALHMLEDLDFYCVDNLPVGLLPDLVAKLSDACQTLAVSIDARNLPQELSHFPDIIKALRDDNIEIQILYLTAEDSVLLKRFKETRRKHPLKNSSLKEAIQSEKQVLETVANFSDLTIDTSHLNVAQLRETIFSRTHQTTTKLPAIMLQSFGYKHGIPIDTDFTFDVRCLPNPFWEPALRSKTGQDPEVKKFLDSHAQVQEMANNIRDFIDKWLPAFEHENRKYLTISIGCTGGIHRSVYLIEMLGSYYTKHRNNVVIRHRELS